MNLAELDLASYAERLDRGARFTSMQAEMERDFMHAALTQPMNAPCVWAPLVSDLDKPLGRLMRHQTVGEVLFDSLDYASGPSVDGVLGVLCAVASGKPMQAEALALLQRMAHKYAEMHVEE